MRILIVVFIAIHFISLVVSATVSSSSRNCPDTLSSQQAEKVVSLASFKPSVDLMTVVEELSTHPFNPSLQAQLDKEFLRLDPAPTTEMVGSSWNLVSVLPKLALSDLRVMGQYSPNGIKNDDGSIRQMSFYLDQAFASSQQIIWSSFKNWGQKESTQKQEYNPGVEWNSEYAPSNVFKSGNPNINLHLYQYHSTLFPTVGPYFVRPSYVGLYFKVIDENTIIAIGELKVLGSETFEEASKSRGVVQPEEYSSSVSERVENQPSSLAENHRKPILYMVFSRSR